VLLSFDVTVDKADSLEVIIILFDNVIFEKVFNKIEFATNL
jgi:hypothetical protein